MSWVWTKGCSLPTRKAPDIRSEQPEVGPAREPETSQVNHNKTTPDTATVVQTVGSRQRPSQRPSQRPLRNIVENHRDSPGGQGVVQFYNPSTWMNGLCGFAQGFSTFSVTVSVSTPWSVPRSLYLELSYSDLPETCLVFLFVQLQVVLILSQGLFWSEGCTLWSELKIFCKSHLFHPRSVPGLCICNTMLQLFQKT